MKGHNVFKNQNWLSKSWLKLFTKNEISRNKLLGIGRCDFLRLQRIDGYLVIYIIKSLAF
jgi:hypothetical protein